MPDRCRIQVVLQGGSALPEDRYVSTFHFDDPASNLPNDTYREACRDLVRTFFGTHADGSTMHSYLSAYVGIVYSTVAYDLLQPPGERIPYPEVEVSGTTPTGGLPSEVGVCLSIAGALPHTSRRRGRLYLGPLSDKSSVMVPASSSVPPRPNLGVGATIGSSLVGRANLLMGSAEPTWCIRSMTPTENYVPVESAWVDNAFDTMRKRGEKPTTRITVPAT